MPMRYQTQHHRSIQHRYGTLLCDSIPLHHLTLRCLNKTFLCLTTPIRLTTLLDHSSPMRYLTLLFLTQQHLALPNTSLPSPHIARLNNTHALRYETRQFFTHAEQRKTLPLQNDTQHCITLTARDPSLPKPDCTDCTVPKQYPTQQYRHLTISNRP